MTKKKPAPKQRVREFEPYNVEVPQVFIPARPMAKAVKPSTAPKCEHKSLAFIDGARRLACCETGCGRAWVLESRRGSYIADVGLTHFALIPEGAPRVAPGAAAKPVPKKQP